jgi:hypothetical protein
MSMSIVVRICALMYRVSLPLYPARLRVEHGPEMLWVFERQLDCASRSGGITAVARVGWIGFRDLFTIAFPSRLGSDCSIAVTGATLISSAVFLFLIRVMQDPTFARWVDHKFLFACR